MKPNRPPNGAGNRFEDLIRRIRTVEAVLGFQLLYHSPAGFNKKTVEKWLRRDAFPRRSSLQEFCRSAGLTLAAFEAAPEELIAELAKISAELHGAGKLPRPFDAERIQGVWEGFSRKGGMMSVFSETVNAIGRKTMAKYFREFQGYYLGFIQWSQWVREADAATAIRGAAFRFLVQVHELDPEQQIIRARLTTFTHLRKAASDPSDKWAYEGAMIPIPGKLIFLLEAPNPSFEEMGFVFIMVQSQPRDQMLGILSSDSSAPDASSAMVQPVPASARIVLQKAPDGRSESELMAELDHENPIPEDILRLVRNELHPDTGILMTRFRSTVF
jgi:hypothetical protein